MVRSCPHQPPVPSPVERARATVDDVRIGFAMPVACPRMLGAEVRRLATLSPAARGSGRRAAER